jgi:hypothetical protein
MPGAAPETVLLVIAFWDLLGGWIERHSAMGSRYGA